MGEHQNRPIPRVPWNTGKLIGQNAPLKLEEIWAIRIRLQLARRARDLALFNLAIDSKLRGCDLVTLQLCDVAQGGHVASRAIIAYFRTRLRPPKRYEYCAGVAFTLSSPSPPWNAQARSTRRNLLAATT